MSYSKNNYKPHTPVGGGCATDHGERVVTCVQLIMEKRPACCGALFVLPVEKF